MVASKPVTGVVMSFELCPSVRQHAKIDDSVIASGGTLARA
jgi:hypothetical protein